MEGFILSKAERDSIINEAVEKALLMLPEVAERVIENRKLHMNISERFYNENPHLRNHTDIVRSVINDLEESAPISSYDELLTKALPIITQRVQLASGLTMDIPETPDLKLPDNGIF